MLLYAVVSQHGKILWYLFKVPHHSVKISKLLFAMASTVLPFSISTFCHYDNVIITPYAFSWCHAFATNLQYRRVNLKQLSLIYLLTAIGLPPGGSCTVHIYTETIHRTTQKMHRIIKQFWKSAGRAPTWRAVPRLGGPCPDLASSRSDNQIYVDIELFDSKLFIL